MKNYNMTLIEKLQKYQLDHQTELISMSILQVKKCDLLIKKKITEKTKFTYSPLGKAFGKQTKEQVKAIKDLNISDKASELEQIESIFSQNALNDLISNKRKKSLSYKTVLN